MLLGPSFVSGPHADPPLSGPLAPSGGVASGPHAERDAYAEYARSLSPSPTPPPLDFTPHLLSAPCAAGYRPSPLAASAVYHPSPLAAYHPSLATIPGGGKYEYGTLSGPSASEGYGGRGYDLEGYGSDGYVAIALTLTLIPSPTPTPALHLHLPLTLTLTLSLNLSLNQVWR